MGWRIDFYKANEIEEFFAYMQPLVDASPDLRVPLEKIISESKSILFGKGKSHKTKAIEVMNILNISYKVANGVMDMVLKAKNKYIGRRE